MNIIKQKLRRVFATISILLNTDPTGNLLHQRVLNDFAAEVVKEVKDVDKARDEEEK